MTTKQTAPSHDGTSSPDQGGSSSMLRVLCLHDSNSSASELSQELETCAEQLFLHHGIDLVFVNSPLLAPEQQLPQPPRGYQDPSLHPRVWWEVDEIIGAAKESTETNTSTKRYVGLDASLLLLRQVWTCTPYWGILAVGQAASVAAFLPLMQVSPRPSFCVFLEGFSLLEGEELLVDNLPCLHVVGKNPSKATERLVQQFGGEVSAGISPTGKASMNRIGKFLVAQKKALRLNPQDVNVLTLQNQLFLAEQQAAHLVAQQIAENPPKALMAVISPKNVGGFSGGKRRAPGEEGGGAPCPSEFLLQRERRTTDPKGPSREHPSRQQQSQEHETQQSSSETTPGEDFAVTVLIENPSKGNNLGPLLRCCSAFGITRIFTVGYDQCAVSGSHGASRHVELVAFPTIETAVRHLVDEEGFELIGLLQGVSQLGDSDVGQDSCPVYKEAVDAARTGSNSSYHSEDIVHVATTASKESAPIANRFSAPAHLRKFSPRTCLVVDKKSRGLPWTMARHCRSFIHVPHFPSINTKQAVTIEACLSIVLYEFTTWAGLDDQSYKGQKYHVKRIQKGSHGDAELLEKKRLERQQKMDTRQAEADDLMVAATSSIFAQGPARHDGDY